jgi:hypothetical protein
MMVLRSERVTCTDEFNKRLLYLTAVHVLIILLYGLLPYVIVRDIRNLTNTHHQHRVVLNDFWNNFIQANPYCTVQFVSCAIDHPTVCKVSLQHGSDRGKILIMLPVRCTCMTSLVSLSHLREIPTHLRIISVTPVFIWNVINAAIDTRFRIWR